MPVDYEKLAAAIASSVVSALNEQSKAKYVQYDMIELSQENMIRVPDKGGRNVFYTPAADGINKGYGVCVDKIESVEGSGVLHIMGAAIDREVPLVKCKNARRADRVGERPKPKVEVKKIPRKVVEAVQPTDDEVIEARKQFAARQHARTEASLKKEKAMKRQKTMARRSGPKGPRAS